MLYHWELLVLFDQPLRLVHVTSHFSIVTAKCQSYEHYNAFCNGETYEPEETDRRRAHAKKRLRRNRIYWLG